MGLSLLESIRKLIRQDTVRIGGSVGNMYGAVRTDLGDAADVSTQTWLVMTIAGRELPTLVQFLDAFAENPSAMRLELATEGTVTVTSKPSTVSLMRTVVSTERTLTFNMDVSVAATGGVAAVYVDGTLSRTVRGESSVPVSLSAGRHVLYVLVVAPSATVTVPPRIPLVGETDVPRAPQWISVTTGYLDELAGTAANVLRWVSDPEVGNYRVLRREPITVGDLNDENGDGEVIEVTDLGTNETFAISIKGDQSERLDLNAVLQAGGESIAVVASVTVTPGATELDPSTTVVTCRLPLGVDAPDPSIVGQILTVGTLTELARVTRVANTSVIEYKDGAVTTGRPYEYALQATGFVDETVLSPLSEIQYVVTGDVYPPGPIIILEGYPRVVRENVTVKFLTPPELDYAGVNVYYREQILNPVGETFEPYHVESISGAVIQTDTEELPIVEGESLEGYTVSFILEGFERYRFRVVSNTTSTITVTDPIPTELLTAITGSATPVGINIYYDTQIKTDYGRANRQDELSFIADTFGLYYFATFDRSNNEQVFEDAVSWDYTADDQDETATQPVLALRQLIDSEQAFFTTPNYTDKTKYAIIEVWAYDPGVPEAQKFEGIKIYYQRLGLDSTPIILTPVPGQDVPFPAIVTSTEQAIVDDPEGTRSRYILLDREYDQVLLWAETALGFTTDITSYFVDLDTTPEIDVEVYYNFLDNTVSFAVVCDDDTNGFKWKVDDGPESILDSRTFKRFDSNSQAQTRLPTIPLALGERKKLYVTPARTYSAGPPPSLADLGEVIVKELVRTPRSYVTFDSKDSKGNRSSSIVAATYTMVPRPVIKASGSGTLSETGGVFSFTVAGAGWTANQWSSYHYLILRPSGRDPVITAIASNTSSALTVGAGLQAYVGSSIPYEIVDGAVMVRVIRGAVASDVAPTLGKEFYTRPSREEEAQGVRLEVEFYATKHGSLPENPRRVLIDSDTLPSLGDFKYQLIEDGEDVFFRLGFGFADDDATSWESYERKGQWPTLDGTSPSANVPISPGVIDRTYLRFSGTVDQTFYDRAASGLTQGDVWYAIAIPKNSFGQLGFPSLAQYTVGDITAPPTTPSLTGMTLTPLVGTNNLRVTYTTNSATLSSAVVNLTAVRSDNPATAQSVALTAGQSPYSLNIGETIVETGGTLRTWTVSTTLFGGNTITKDVTFRTSPSNTATITLNTFSQTYDTGECGPSGCGDPMSRPHQRIVRWEVYENGVLVTSPAAPYYVNIEVAYNETIDGNSVWTPIVYGVHASQRSYIDTTYCLFMATGQQLPAQWRYWTYRVMVVGPNGAQVGPQIQTNRVQEYSAVCGNGNLPL